MKQIIEEVLQAEEKTGKILEQAREKAMQIQNAADAQINEKMKQARQESQELIRSIVEKARSEAEEVRAEKLRQAGSQKEQLLAEKADVISRLVERICQVVSGTEEEGH